MLSDSHTKRLCNANNPLLYCVDGNNLSYPIGMHQIKNNQSDTPPLTLDKNQQYGRIEKKYYVSAFTLIELLVTLCVLGILLMVAIPSFRTMILNNRISSNADALVNALNYARGTALTLAMNIKVCPVGTPGSTTCGADWSDGWIVVTEPASGAATLLKSQQNAGNAPTVSANASEVLFDRYGLSTTQSNFTLCDSRGGTFARSVEVLATGYVQSGTAPGQAVWNNGTLTCP
jgi:type IV fimbrial biogenesis protein FimT